METGRQRVQRLGLGAGLVAIGVAHFAQPKQFEDMVPEYVPGSPKRLNQLAGAMEIASGALLLNRRTRVAGGYLAFGTIAGVYIANVQAAIDGGMQHLSGFAGSKEAAYIRLPFQFPMLWLAWRQTRPLPD